MTDERTRLYLLVGDIARRSSRSTATVNLWIKHHGLTPAATTPSGLRLFDECDVEEFVKRRRSHHTGVGR